MKTACGGVFAKKGLFAMPGRALLPTTPACPVIAGRLAAVEMGTSVGGAVITTGVAVSTGCSSSAMRPSISSIIRRMCR